MVYRKLKAQAGAQAGFTLIELIVVIVILGILAATALPKFADMGSDARSAKIKGAAGAVSSAAAIVHAKWLLNKTSPVTMEGSTSIAVSAEGYPTAVAIVTAATLSESDFSGIDSTTIGTATTVTAQDKSKPLSSCQFTYDQATGQVTVVTTTC